MYKPTQKEIWTGRAIGPEGAASQLWHHVVQLIDLGALSPAKGKNIALLGFCTDEGVKRNLGRPGAKEGPAAIRKALCNLAVHHDETTFTLYDAGDVVCERDDLENATQECIQAVSQLKSQGYFPLLLGGGHEISYAHVTGIQKAKSSSNIGVINLDAHFDLRPYPNGAHSGSWARQLADESRNFYYLPIGIHQAVNNRALFLEMEKHGLYTILLDDIHQGLPPTIRAQIAFFIERVDEVCLTLDLDVISGAHAPGVSAPAAFGLSPERTLEIIELIFKNGKVGSVDIAELNPTYDDGRTAKLAALMVWQVSKLLSA